MTVSVGREAVLTCIVANLSTYKVSCYKHTTAFNLALYRFCFTQGVVRMMLKMLRDPRACAQTT
ncbi:hypothetical protein X777_16337 [Ooceraea biroi]|uniref:Uncharacterized protein n=1 Tax=Ooceraea biroi TaxID=2015173 RepID=A0A026VU15_OOCBI|nr:hypothetical protein X777_16337 [Ooceraea biroi]